MTSSILNRLSLKSFKAHRNLFFPFTLSMIILLAMEYILLSLKQNPYLQARSNMVQTLFGIGLFFATFLIGVIVLYASNFIRKSLSKEYGLYHILGLEKKHLLYLSAVQLGICWLATMFFSVGFGYLGGQLAFKGLNIMFRNTGTTLMDYPFLLDVLFTHIVIVTAIFLLVFIFWMIGILRHNPINLLKSTQRAERAPKSRYLLLLLGLISLGVGYWIALTTEGVLNAFNMIFLALFAVIIGTFLLFLSFSTIVLKHAQKLPSYYRKPNRFLTVSSMLHRLQNSAVSLASISILVSGVIFVLTMSTTLNSTLDQNVKRITPYDVTLTLISKTEEYAGDLDDLTEQIQKEVEVKDFVEQNRAMTVATFKDNQLLPVKEMGLDTLSQKDFAFVLFQTLDEYNAIYGHKISLGADQVLVGSNIADIKNLQTVELAGQKYQVKQADLKAIPSQFGIQLYYIVAPDQSTFDHLRQSYPDEAVTGQQSEAPHVDRSYLFNLQDQADLGRVKQIVDDFHANRGVTVEATYYKDARKDFYSMYGGLLFIGLIVSSVLVVGTILMLYYKQISEGYEDRENYLIMQRVGLPKAMIRQTIMSQIIWIFGLPLLVAVVHNLFASKIVYNLLGMVGLNDPLVYWTSFIGVTVIFAVIYLVFYLLTSKTYYEIVGEK